VAGTVRQRDVSDAQRETRRKELCRMLVDARQELIDAYV
jgi:hypothetical protein